MKTYTVKATRTAAWWAVAVPEVPGAFGQAKRLDQVEEVARDVIELMTDDPGGAFEITLDVDMGDPIDTLLDETERARQQLEASMHSFKAKREAAASALKREGLSVRDVGALLGVSFQRASQLLKSPASADENENSPRTYR